MLCFSSVGDAANPLLSFDPAYQHSLLSLEANSHGEREPMPEPFVAGFCSCYGPIDGCFRPNPLPDDFWLPAVDAPQGSLTRYGPVHPDHTGSEPCLADEQHTVVEASKLFDAASPHVAGEIVLPDPGRIRSHIRSLAISAPIILHSFNIDDVHDYKSLMSTWAAHCRRVGLQNHVLLVGMSTSDCEFGRTLAPCIVNNNTVSGFNRTLPADVRWLWSLALLRARVDVVQTDADALPLANFMADLERIDAPFVSALSDRDFYGTAPPFGSALWYCRTDPLHPVHGSAPCQSTAFMHMRPLGPVLHEVWSMVHELQSTSTVLQQREGAAWEQEMWDGHARRLQAQGQQVWFRRPDSKEADCTNKLSLIPKCEVRLATGVPHPPVWRQLAVLKLG